MMRFVQSYARAHAHAYPHTPMRICQRTHIGSSREQTEHSRGGLTLQTLSSEERLRHAPFLTNLDGLSILKQFLRTSKHLAPSIPSYACTKSARYVSQRSKRARRALGAHGIACREEQGAHDCMIAPDAHGIACREVPHRSMQFDRHVARSNEE